jgi:DNA-binding NarL/FixJ family response regulator
MSAQQRYSVIIATAQPVVNIGIENILRRDRRFQIGYVHTLDYLGIEQLLTVLDQRRGLPKADVGLVTYEPHKDPNREVARAIRERMRFISMNAPSPKPETDAKNALVAMLAGASGWYPLETTAKELPTAVKEVAQGGRFLPKNTYEDLIETLFLYKEEALGLYRPAIYQEQADITPIIKKLARRECEVLELSAQGYDKQEVAIKMKISESTVKNHKHYITDKLGLWTGKDLNLVARLLRQAKGSSLANAEKI